MKRRLKKETRYRIWICTIISVTCIVYFIVSALYYSVNVAKLHNEEKELTASLKELQAKEVELSSEIEKLKDPDYVARYARENYLYSRDGEYIIKIDKDKKKLDNNDSQPKNVKLSEEIILIVAGGLGIVILLGTIISKNKKKTTKKSS